MAEQEKLFLTSKELKKFLKKQIPFWDRRYWTHCAWLLPDSRFYCPEEEYALEQGDAIAKYVRALGIKWTEESYDCDDFACMGSARFKRTNFKDGVVRAGWAGGEIWGMLVMDPNKPPVPHAMCWTVMNIGGKPKFMIMEPQDGSWREFHKNDTSIRMVKA